jgi:hypothetical protein
LVLMILAAGAPRAAVGAQGDLPEVPVRTIELSGPAASLAAELSGLAWSGDTLLLVAENPYIYAADGFAGMFFALEKADLLTYLDAVDPAPLEPRPVPIMAPDIRASVPNFDGFEAAAFWEDRIFLVIEARRADGTTYGYLVRGTAAPGLAHITLDFDRVVELPPPSDQPNIGYESLFVSMGIVVVIGEANGLGAVAMVFDTGLNYLDSMLFPPVPYRLTDVTPPQNGIFWGINTGVGSVESDPLVERSGEGATHRHRPQVERMVAFEFSADASAYRVEVVEDSPVYLELSILPRNWEGIARLDGRGFLLVTDLWPRTLLGFVAWPDQPHFAD